MIHSIQQIIENQSKFKKEIIDFLKNDFRELRRELMLIKTNDTYIKEQKNKLTKRLKSTKLIKSIDSLFFLSKKRSEDFYAWWDDENKETIIMMYGKK